MRNITHECDSLQAIKRKSQHRNNLLKVKYKYLYIVIGCNMGFATKKERVCIRR